MARVAADVPVSCRLLQTCWRCAESPRVGSDVDHDVPGDLVLALD